MGRTKRVGIMTACILCILLALAACSGGNGTTSETEAIVAPASNQSSAPEATETPTEELDPVELIWYYPAVSVPSDLQTVEDAVNQITKANINATIKLMPVNFGDYDQKMNTVVASGDKIDIIWTSSWLFDYARNQGKGAFVALDELIDQYAPELKASLPDFVFNAARIGGKVYAVPNYQTVTYREGFVIQKRFADKYNLDVSSIQQLEDIEPFLAQIKAGEPGITAFGMDSSGVYGNIQQVFGYEHIASMLSINLETPSQVLNKFETPGYKRYLDLMRDFYVKGYINQDAAMVKNFTESMKSGNIAVFYHSSLNAGREAADKSSNGGHDVVLAPLTPPYVQTGSVIATMQAISRTSENPERAMMFLNLLNTDKELYNTITYGIEGKHFVEVSDNVVRVNPDAGYDTNADWVFGNVFNGYLLEGKDAAIVARMKHDNETASPSPIMGFIFLSSAVSAEIANITTVIDQYGPALNTGTIDPNENLAEFLDKLQSAGIEEVVAEAQAQLDAFHSAK